MKKLATTVLSVVVLSVLAASPAFAQSKKADTAPATAAAITQEKAQQLALQRYPGAHVLSTKMDSAKGKWVVTYTRTGGNLTEKLAVDAQTGKVTRM